jgi:hypothetical protein
MANPKGNVNSLKHYESKWKSGATKTIRVPIALADQTLTYARRLDASSDANDPLEDAIVLLTEALKLKPNAGGAIKAKIRSALELLTAQR